MPEQPDLWILNYASASVDEACLALWEGVLDEHEHAHASARQRFGDKISYVAAHALLRIVLGERLNLLPQDLRFAVAHEGGKPFLRTDRSCFFSLSHADGIVAVALATGEVGVDIERIDAAPLTDDFIAHISHPQEKSALAACSIAERTKRAAQIWTAKEAYAKALGKGLALPFADICVELSPSKYVTDERATLWIGEAFEDGIVSLCTFGGALSPHVHYIEPEALSRRLTFDEHLKKTIDHCIDNFG